MSTMPNAMPAFSGDPTGAGAIFAGPVDDGGPALVVAKLNGLLRGEISAAETYRNVLEKVVHGEHTENVAALRPLQDEHVRTAQLLRQRIVDLGGEPAETSGVWGMWAQVVQGTLTLFGGDLGGLRALREGEEHGLKDYESALNEVDATSAQMIQNQCIPNQQRHLAALESMMATKA